jgi:hypothetical protein
MEQILWGIAIPVTLTYIAQAIATFSGIDSHDGTSADFNGDLDHSEELVLLQKVKETAQKKANNYTQLKSIRNVH